MVFKMEDSGLPGSGIQGWSGLCGDTLAPGRSVGGGLTLSHRKGSVKGVSPGGEETIWDEFPRLSKSSGAPSPRPP